jgi:hypothetical protein
VTSRIPPEPQSWEEPPDAEAVARDLREQLARAKARMQEHREQMHAAGLTKTHEPDNPGA